MCDGRKMEIYGERVILAYTDEHRCNERDER